jgi:predicted RNase H-like nuclease (RuvC/YqgF family)
MTQSATPVNEKTELERDIDELEQGIFALKQRYANIQLAEREQVVLQRNRNELKQKGSKHPEVRHELKMIQARLEELEAILESQLWKWDPFWDIARFMGLGIAIGWGLCSWGK